MQSILSNIQDPAWWFTVFLVGIVVSIAAGFLKDWISVVFAKHSQKFREQRKAKATRREALYEALATNEVFLVLSMIRLTGLVTISFIIMAFYASLPAIAELKEILCTVAPASDKCTGTNHPFAARLLIVATGAVGMLANYKASSRFLLVMRGLRRYRIRHGLPRVV